MNKQKLIIYLFIILIILLISFIIYKYLNTKNFKYNNQNDIKWEDDLINVTHYYDCNGQTCDAELLATWDKSKFVAPAGYTVLDPNDHGGALYGEKMWIYGATSDDLTNMLGENIRELGCVDNASGPNKGCGRSILIKNKNAKNSDWTALVMRKNRCPPWSHGCDNGNKHLDLMIPGFDNTNASTANICGNPNTALTKEESEICGDLNIPKNCTECNKITNQKLSKGCQLFVDWGWNTGNPDCNYAFVDTPQKFIEYTKDVQLKGQNPC